MEQTLTGYMDEVGKGAWFGPLVVCMIICDEIDYLKSIGVRDSKKLSPKKRAHINELLQSTELNLTYSFGVISNKYIDKYGIELSMREAYIRAFNTCTVKPSSIIIDGGRNYLSNKGLKVTTIIKGDDRIIQIGAASILAKVYRDNMIERLDTKYPEYNLKSNKGYGTQDHINGIYTFGATKLHRMSFIKNYISK
jgi:ribonuclease HII